MIGAWANSREVDDEEEDDELGLGVIISNTTGKIRVAHFAIFENLVFAIAFKILRILIEHME